MTLTNLRSPAILVPGLFLLTLLGLLLALATIGNTGGVVHGATLTVTNLNDAGAGSLRQAIIDAAPSDTIDFAVTGTITLTSGQLTISKDLVISGPGSGDLTISGNNASRVFDIPAGDVAISGVTIADGNTSGIGGGISNSGTLTLNESSISGNSSTGFGGGGGIFNGGTVNLNSSTITNNFGSIGGGGIFSNAFGSLLITNTTISDNNTPSSGGGIASFGALTVTKSTISDNTAGSNGGGVYSDTGNNVTLTNTTFSGNTSGNFGGGLMSNFGTVTLTNVTVTDNTANVGGGVANFGTFSLVNTIVANSISGGDCNGTITSLGHNLDSDGTCGLGAGGDLSNVVPLLGLLANNGGPTKTHALQPGSPGIDAGDDAAAPSTDQRGVARPQGPTSDIGAFELEPVITCKGLVVTILGTSSGETITGTPLDDVIVALDGDDVILGKGGDDTICAGLGDDLVHGGPDKDRVFGEEGNDTVLAGCG